MKIAFIMLCHKNPQQINMLINKLSEFSKSDIYVHVDLNHKDIKSEIKPRRNLFFLPVERSFHVSWGGLDMVRATLELIRFVRESGKEYQYIWLVSGQDYPICTVAQIEKHLEASKHVNYIQTLLPGDEKYNRYKKFYEICYSPWMNGNNIPIKIIKRIYMISTGGYTYTFPFLVRKKPFDFNFSFGSQWWTLTPEAAFDILNYSDQHPEFIQYYERCNIPDECFFQTLFMRGPFQNQRSMNLTFINWGKNRRSPETLTEQDFAKLRDNSRTFCFARKFELPQSQNLISSLEEYLHG